MQKIGFEKPFFLLQQGMEKSAKHTNFCEAGIHCKKNRFTSSIGTAEAIHDADPLLRLHLLAGFMYDRRVVLVLG
jgi:hypothetical protein